jgi:hypothetical protein
VRKRFFGSYVVTGPGVGSSSGKGSGSGDGWGGWGSGSGSGDGEAFAVAARKTARADAAETPRPTSDKVTSHSQQSLQRRHFSHRWLSQASLVHRAQILVDSSPQMLQRNGMGTYFFLTGPLVLGAAWVTIARQRCASWSITSRSRSRCDANSTMYR